MDNKIENKISELFDSVVYKLLEKIGEGGFGRVYRAIQINTGQIVAIKFLAISDEFDTEKKQRYIERFERETLLGSRLQHPNIVRLLDKGSCHDDLLYAVFEYIDGKTLKQTLAETSALGALETAQIMAQVLDALAHAHEKGVIHRDIKPANIMLVKVGAKTHVKVLDFGIGTLVNEARQLNYKSITLTHETLGTPSYSAPEQLRGEPPTTKTDLYVWGLLFIECLTGQVAISGSNLASVFHKQLSDVNVPLPASIVGHPVGALLRRVLQKKVFERNVKAVELYQELLKINFSNLVGMLASQAEQKIRFNTTEHIHEDQETRTNYNPKFYTGLIERKQITALSICLNIQAVAQDSLDHEVMDALHRDQKNQCIDTAIRYGACHVGSLSDSLLFYFGYPVASDNDIRLCARTALDIVSNLNKRNAILRESQGIEFEVQLGMHTGLVTCYADAIPEGDTSNIAMKLARMAGKEQILCSDLSRKMLDTHTEFKHVKTCTLGMGSEMTALYNLVAERHVEAFGFLRGKQKNHAFIGRDLELNQLSALLSSKELNNNQNNNANLAHVHGEAGIGKSRLVFELRNKAQKMSHNVAQCLPEHQHNALYPILNILKYQYSLDSLSPSDAAERLNHAVQLLESHQNINKEQGLIILSAWLNLPLKENQQPSALPPDSQKQHLFTVLNALLTHQGESPSIDSQGVTIELRNLFIFEDMHWADPTSLEFINQFVTSLKPSRDVFISTSRQALPESLNELGFEPIAVNKLTPAATSEFIVSLFENEAVSDNVLDVLVSRTDGIPLFIEELVNMLKQKELVHQIEGKIDFVSPDKLDEVPNTLRDSLQQKLDSLVHAKETAQLAATIGREFDYDLLVAVSENNESQVQSDLNELIEAEIIYQQRKVDGDNYIFKHALVRDATYESMAQATQKKAHLIIATAISNGFGVNPEDSSGILHYHYLAGQSYSEAAHFGKKAAMSAIEKSAYEQSIHYAEATLSALKKINADGQTQLEVNQLLTTASMMVVGWASSKVENLIKYSQQLLESLGQRHQSIDTAIQLANHVNVVGDVKKVLNIIDSSLQLTEDPGQRAGLLAVKSHALWRAGKLHQGLDCVAEARRLYDPIAHSEHAIQYGQDTNIWALSIASLIYACLGDCKKFHKSIKEAENLAKQLKSSHCLVLVKIYAAGGFYFFNERAQVRVKLEESKAICEQDNLINWFGIIDAMEGWLQDDGDRIAQSVQALEAIGAKQMHGLWHGMLVEVKLKKGLWDEALKIIDKSIIQTERFNEDLFLPKLLWLKSRCYLKQGNSAQYERFNQLYIEKTQQLSVKLPYTDIEKKTFIY